MIPSAAARASRAFAGRTATALGAVVTALLVGLPRTAAACAVCFGGKDSDWSGGFLLGTTLMLLLPPAIVVCAGVAIWRAMKRQEARLRERDAARATGATRA